MKINIKTHSVRFRVTPEELQQLSTSGSLAQDTPIPTETPAAALFRLEITHHPNADRSRLIALPFGMRLVLNDEDFHKFTSNPGEGIYLRHEWPEGSAHAGRFVAYLELDKEKRNLRSQPDADNKNTNNAGGKDNER